MDLKDLQQWVCHGFEGFEAVVYHGFEGSAAVGMSWI